MASVMAHVTDTFTSRSSSSSSNLGEGGGSVNMIYDPLEKSSLHTLPDTDTRDILVPHAL